MNWTCLVFGYKINMKGKLLMRKNVRFEYTAYKINFSSFSFLPARENIFVSFKVLQFSGIIKIHKIRRKKKWTFYRNCLKAAFQLSWSYNHFPIISLTKKRNSITVCVCICVCFKGKDRITGTWILFTCRQRLFNGFSMNVLAVIVLTKREPPHVHNGCMAFNDRNMIAVFCNLNFYGHYTFPFINQ